MEFFRGQGKPIDVSLNQRCFSDEKKYSLLER
jgi:hypothetical protein